MPALIVVLGLIAQSALSSHRTDDDCTAELDRSFNGDVRAEMTAVDASKPLEYVSANHKNLHDVAFDGGRNRLAGLDLRRNERIVIVYETETAAAASRLSDHSCHVFFDFP